MNNIPNYFTNLHPILLLIIGISIVIILGFLIYIIAIKQGREIGIYGIKIGSANTVAKSKKEENKIYKYDAFFSSPMLGYKSDEKYMNEQDKVLQLIDSLKSYCQLKDIFYIGSKVKSAEGQGLPDVAVQESFKALESSRYYIGMFPEKVVTGAFIEAGFAIAHNISSVIFVHDIDDLPSLLKKSPSIFPFIKIYVYKDMDDLLSQIREYGLKIFNQHNQR